MTPDDQAPIQYRRTHHTYREHSPVVIPVMIGVALCLGALLWSALSHG